MSLLDFLSMNAMTRARLRDISNRMPRPGGHSSRKINELETDLNALALVCLSLVGTLVEKGVISELDLEMHLDALDDLDGDKDGGLDVNALREALGMKPVERKALPTGGKLRKKPPSEPRGGPVPPKPRKKR